MADKVSENLANGKTSGGRSLDIRPARGTSRRGFLSMGLGLAGGAAFTSVATAILGRAAMRGSEGVPASGAQETEDKKASDEDRRGTLVGKAGVNKIGSYFLEGATDAMGVDMSFHLETAKEMDAEEFYKNFPSEAVIASLDNKTFIKPKAKQTASNNP